MQCPGRPAPHHRCGVGRRHRPTVESCAYRLRTALHDDALHRRPVRGLRGRAPGQAPHMDQYPALGLDESALAALLAQQDGVVSRRQLRSLGAQRHDIDRLLRRHRLAQSHPRVYVDHTGPLTPRQRAWAAVLYAAPAALSGRSALADPEPNAPVHVSIDASRRLTAPDGVRIQRRRDFAAQVLWNASPPRLRYDAAVLDLVEEASDEMAVVRLLSDAIGSRRTTVARLRSTLAGRSRMPRRRWLSRLLDDLATGACSVLEHAYLTRVERAHGLPLPDRQAVRTGVAGREYRDASYAAGRPSGCDGTRWSTLPAGPRCSWPASCSAAAGPACRSPAGRTAPSPSSPRRDRGVARAPHVPSAPRSGSTLPA